MIVVTMGTERFPFDRLIRDMDELVEKRIITGEVFVQTGYSNYKPRFCSNENFIPINKLIDLIRNADFVVTHGGAGSVLLSLSLGKVPILYPRLSRYGEHVDDHQVEFAEHIQGLAVAPAAFDLHELAQKIKGYPGLVDDMNRKELIESRLRGFSRNIRSLIDA